MVKFYYEKYDPDYDHDDYEVTEKASEKRRIRNIHIGIGFFMGVGATLGAQYLALWVLNVV